MPAPHLINSGRLFTFISGTSTPYAAGVGAPGTLGQSPQTPLGIYDTRPWEGRPKGNVSNKDWKRNTTAAPGGELVIRLVRHPTDAQGSVFFQPGETDYQRNAATSLLIGAFDELDGDQFGNQNDPPTGAPQRDVAGKAVRMGPNITPLLQGTGVAEVDLLAWAGGARFVSVWAWTYWIHVANIPADLLVWEIRDRTVPGPDLEGDTLPGPWAQPAGLRWKNPVQAVSFPVPVVQDGPITIADANAIFRWGGFPGAQYYAWSASNGGPVDLEVQIEKRVGAIAADSENLIVLAGASATTVVPRTDAGWSNSGLYATNRVAAGFLGGPIIVSVTGGGAGG